MYTLLILFFVSLLAIIFMIGRKLMLLKNGHATVEIYDEHPLIPDLQKIKQLTRVGGKRIGYLALVATLRLYVKFTNTLQNEYRGLKAKIERMRRAKNGSNGEVENEANKFLRLISEYKDKIRHIKHRITEEEKNQ